MGRTKTALHACHRPSRRHLVGAHYACCFAVNTIIGLDQHVVYNLYTKDLRDLDNRSHYFVDLQHACYGTSVA